MRTQNFSPIEDVIKTVELLQATAASNGWDTTVPEVYEELAREKGFRNWEAMKAAHENLETKNGGEGLFAHLTVKAQLWSAGDYPKFRDLALPSSSIKRPCFISWNTPAIHALVGAAAKCLDTGVARFTCGFPGPPGSDTGPLDETLESAVEMALAADSLIFFDGVDRFPNLLQVAEVLDRLPRDRLIVCSANGRDLLARSKLMSRFDWLPDISM